MVPTGGEHGWVAARFGSRLVRHVEAHDLGVAFAAETGFRLTVDPDTVRAPDAAFMRWERVPPPAERHGYWPGAPDLAVEVLSPDDRPGEVAQKVAMWLAYGARLVIVADPVARTLRLHRPGQPATTLTAADTLDADDAVPGWTIAVADLFPPAVPG
jgi:Uma2 family endonuclease